MNISKLGLVFFLDGFGIVFVPCFPAIIGRSCNMTCITQDFSQQVSILCNGTRKGSCGLFGCSSDMYQLSGTNITYYEIRTLSYDTHSCNWSCSYGLTQSVDMTVVIYGKYMYLFILRRVKII